MKFPGRRVSLALIFAASMAPRSAFADVSDGDSVSHGSLGRAVLTCTPGAPDIPLLTVTLTPLSNEWDIGGFEIANSSGAIGAGPASDAEMGTVKVWLDADMDGLPNNADELLASGTFSGGPGGFGGTATLTCGTPYRLLASNSPAPRDLLFTITTADDIGEGKYVSIAPTLITHGASGGADADHPVSGVGSADFPVTRGSVKIVQISTTDGGSLNEFIQLANGTSAAIDITGWELRRRSAGGTIDSVLALSGSIPAASHFLIASNNYTAAANSLGAVDMYSGNPALFTTNLDDAAGASIGLYNGFGAKIDGFSFNGGATNPNGHNDGTPFSGGPGASATFARIRAHSGYGMYVDTDRNSRDEELITGAGSKSPPHDGLVPVALSSFSAE